MKPLVQLAWFGLVGGSATLAYAGLAWVMTVQLGWWPGLASAVAYALCGIASFASHKRLTFASSAPARPEIARFVAVTLLGYGLAYGVPQVLTENWHMNPLVAIAVVCVLCPALNYVMLRFFVFGPAIHRNAPNP